MRETANIAISAHLSIYIYIYILSTPFAVFCKFLANLARNDLKLHDFLQNQDGYSYYHPIPCCFCKKSCVFAEIFRFFCKSRRKQRVLAKTVTGNQKFTPKRCCPRIFSAAYGVFHFPEYHPAAHRTWFLTVYAIRPFLIFGKKYVIIIIEKEIKQVLFQINKFQKEINYGF